MSAGKVLRKLKEKRKGKMESTEQKRNGYTRKRLEREGRTRMMVDLPHSTVEKLAKIASENGIYRKNHIENVLNKSVEV
jgi:hypothetical protein